VASPTRASRSSTDGSSPATEDGRSDRFNGEIFNYVELREELAVKGHRFRTASDTEVIVHAWEEWGDDAVSRFNGQWAFAIWDRRKKRLVLSRDRLGVRPLYVTRNDGRLSFASEVKALFVDPGVRRELDPLGLDQVFTFWTTVAPRTPFAGIEELPPGHTLTVDLAGEAPKETQRCDWAPSYPSRDELRHVSIEAAAAGLLERLERAVTLRLLRADVPVGCYLSGGIDSSVIAALGRRAKSGVFRTFSLRFADQEFDETPYQRLMAERLEAEHAEVVCTRSDIARVFPDVIAHTERPVLRSAPAPMSCSPASSGSPVWAVARRRQRRDAGGVRHLSRGQGARLLGPRAEIDVASEAARAALPVSCAESAGGARDVPAVFRRRARSGP
jgi:asparagine synthase (glutamine-hydrolysing)